MKNIWVNGSFDIVHIGHVKLLEYAATLGSVRVGVDSDERIKERKGEGRPFNNLKDRMDFLSALRHVDSVTSFNSDEELENEIKRYEPDIMVIGNDYTYDTIIGIEYIPKVEFFEKIKNKSTSIILSNGKNFSNRGKM